MSSPAITLAARPAPFTALPSRTCCLTVAELACWLQVGEWRFAREAVLDWLAQR
jgi:hypothetical protein